MSSRELEIRPLEAAFGAQVIGADPADELDEQTPRHDPPGPPSPSRPALPQRATGSAARTGARGLRSALRPSDHPLTTTRRRSPGHPEIVRVSNVEEAGRPIGLAGEQAIPWHHDPSLSRVSGQGRASSRRSSSPPTRRRPPSSTWPRPLAALPAALRKRLRGLHAVHHIDERRADAGESPGSSGTCGVTPGLYGRDQYARPGADRRPARDAPDPRAASR